MARSYSDYYVGLSILLREFDSLTSRQIIQLEHGWSMWWIENPRILVRLQLAVPVLYPDNSPGREYCTHNAEGRVQVPGGVPKFYWKYSSIG